MSTDAGSPTAHHEQVIQERQYYLPYHYIPRRGKGRIVYAARVDSAGEYLKLLDLVESVMRTSGAARMLDIGCGDGRLINELSGKFAERTFAGLDYSARAIALAQVYREHPNVEFLKGDLDHAALATSSYDLVTLIEVLEHIPPDDLESFVRRAFAMVASSGTLLVTVPHANKPVQRKHFQHFTGDALRALLVRASGGASVTLQFLDPRPRGLSWLRAKLAANRFFTIEPLFQAELRRRSALDYVDEPFCGRIVAIVRRA